MSETDPPATAPSMVQLLELLGRRWALRILWELREGPATFQEVQARCDGMSSSVLSQRLAELREASLVDKQSTGYALTDPGLRLLERLDGLDQWTQQATRGSARGAASGVERPA